MDRTHRTLHFLTLIARFTHYVNIIDINTNTGITFKIKWDFNFKNFDVSLQDAISRSAHQARIHGYHSDSSHQVITGTIHINMLLMYCKTNNQNTISWE